MKFSEVDLGQELFRNGASALFHRTLRSSILMECLTMRGPNGLSSHSANLQCMHLPDIAKATVGSESTPRDWLLQLVLSAT